MRRSRRSYPLHPFPLLTAAGGPAYTSTASLRASRPYRQVLAQLRQGARLLLHIDRKRALVYTFKRGVEHLMEITVRVLSDLIKAGLVIATGQEGRVVHYGYAAAQ